jgi:hypothetical protein
VPKKKKKLNFVAQCNHSIGLDLCPIFLVYVTADQDQHPTDPAVTVSEDTLVKNEKGRTIVSEKIKSS